MSVNFDINSLQTRESHRKGESRQDSEKINHNFTLNLISQLCNPFRDHHHDRRAQQ
jgi:hypothetical protein